MAAPKSTHNSEALAQIKLLILDVDGILTDNAIFMAEDGTHLKRFSIADGFGIHLMLQAGLKVAIVSGHASEATVHRFQKLGVTDVLTGVKDKAAPVEALLSKYKLATHEVAAMGDELIDLPMLSRVGFVATVPEAAPEVLEKAHYVTTRKGGHGAVREVAEKILRAQGVWSKILARYAS